MVAPSTGADDIAALFVADGEHLVPTERARGPWSPLALHGGPVAALTARAAESVAGHDELQLVRLTLELLRPVPLAPLRVTAAVVKPGRKAQLIDTVIEADGVEVAWSRALRIHRASEEQRAAPTTAEDGAPPSHDGVASTPLMEGGARAFHNQGMEMRYVGGRVGRPGPATVWFRLRCPVIAGEEPTPWQRVAAAADFGNGVSAELDFASSTFINPDLTISVHRPPVGEWVCLDARTRFGTAGIGAAESALWDVEGRIGRAVQNLVVEVGR
jgi:acyl-coenzyme A thioesterase PaaI-like protein